MTQNQKLYYIICNSKILTLSRLVHRLILVNTDATRLFDTIYVYKFKSFRNSGYKSRVKDDEN